MKLLLTTKELRKPKTTLVSEDNIVLASSNEVMLCIPGPVFFLIHVTIASLHHNQTKTNQIFRSNKILK